MPDTHISSRPGASGLILLAGAAVAVLANAVVALSALSAGANSTFAPLSLPVYGAFTVGGFLASFAGWQVIRHRAHHPRMILRLLVPAVLALSFIPDIGVLVSHAIPGATLSGVTALMIMHLTVAAIALPVYERVAPVFGRHARSKTAAQV